MPWSGCPDGDGPLPPAAALVGVPTFAALRAMPGSPGDVVSLEGYNAAGEANQTLFRWNAIAAPDDGVTRANAGAANVAGWQRIYVGYIDVRWAGAVGDGFTDDTAAIARAVAAANALGTGLFFSKTSASYLITDAIVLASPIHVDSDGAKITQSGVKKRGFQVSSSNIRIENLYLYNSRGGLDWIDGTATNAIGVDIEAVSEVTVNNCKIENWGCVGIRVGTQGRGCLISENEIIGIGVAGGLFVGANTNTGIYANLTGGIDVDSGIRIEGNRIRDLAQGIVTGTEQSNIVIVGNQVSNIIGQHGLYLGTARNLTVAGNSIRNCGLDGIKLAFSPAITEEGTSYAFTGNVIDTVGASGLVFGDNAINGFRMRGLVVSANSVSNTTADGIYINAVDGFIVSNNAVRNAGTFGLRLDVKCRTGVISSNRIEGSVNTGMFCNAESTAYPIVVEHNFIHNCGGVGTNSIDRCGVTLFAGAYTFRENRIDWSGVIPGTYANTLYVNVGVACEEYDNYLVVGAYPTFVDPGATINVAASNRLKSYNGRTDVGVVTLDPRVDAYIQRWTAGATAVTAQFATANALKGDKFLIVKDYTTGGALTVNLVSGSRTFSVDQRGSAEVFYDGSAWVMSSFSVNSALPSSQINLRTTVGVVTLDPNAGDATTQVWTAATSAVTVQFATSGVPAGARFRVVKDYTTGGSMLINLVANSRTFLAGERGSIEVIFDGTNWITDDFSNLNFPNSIGNGPLEFIETATAAGVKQDACTSDVAPLNLTLTPQAPFATASGTNRDPSNVIAALAAPTNSGAAEGQLRVTRGGTFVGAIGSYPAAPTVYGCLWLGYNIAANTGAGSALFANGTTDTYLNVPTNGTVGLAIQGVPKFTLTSSGVLFTANTFAYDQSVAPTFRQNQRTGDNAANDFNIQAQDASSAATGTNEHGANVVLTGGARDGVGNAGGVKLRIGGGSVVVDVGATGTTPTLAFYGGTKVAQPTVTGALSTVTDAAAKAVLTSIIAALKATTGVDLLIDGTT